MSKIVFKQWIYKPNKISTPKTISRMMEYIATREGVELSSFRFEDEINALDNSSTFDNELYVNYIATRKGVATKNSSHGLFGKMQGMKEIGNIEDLSSARSYVENLAHSKKTIYNAVISLKTEDAVQKGLTARKGWETLVSENINDIAREMGIPPRTLEYACAVHMEKDHPHVHLMYWDTEQTIGVNFIHPEKSNLIRKSLIKNVYHDELRDLMEKKDFARKDIINQIYTNEDSIIKSSKNVFCNMPYKAVYKICSSSADKQYKILNRRTANQHTSSLAADLLSIDNALKTDYPKGALKYQYLPTNIKSSLDTLSKKIIQDNPDVARAYREYLNDVKKQSLFFGGQKNAKQYTDKAIDSLLKEIGNKILSTVKDIRTVERESQSELQRQSYNQIQALNLMQDILNIIAQNSAATNKNKKTAKDMSKAEKADYYKKHQDVSLEWGE